MTKQEFTKRILLSCLVTVVVIALIIGFGIDALQKYSAPNEENTYLAQGTVVDLYSPTREQAIILELSNGDQLRLVYTGFIYRLYDSIGYDFDRLSQLLEGQQIEYLGMKDLHWVLEINAGGVIIDNRVLTGKGIAQSRRELIILVPIMLALTAGAEIAYLKTTHDHYQRAEKKRLKKAKRAQRNMDRVK